LPFVLDEIENEVIIAKIVVRVRWEVVVLFVIGTNEFMDGGSQAIKRNRRKQ
jgi:hypothetical protein